MYTFKKNVFFILPYSNKERSLFKPLQVIICADKNNLNLKQLMSNLNPI